MTGKYGQERDRLLQGKLPARLSRDFPLTDNESREGNNHREAEADDPNGKLSLRL